MKAGLIAVLAGAGILALSSCGQGAPLAVSPVAPAGLGQVASSGGKAEFEAFVQQQGALSAQMLAGPACGSRANWTSGNWYYSRFTDHDGSTSLLVIGRMATSAYGSWHSYHWVEDC